MTREPEWDDEQRTRMLALLDYESGVHETCGLHDSIAREDPHFTLEDSYCPACADVERFLRRRANDEHEAEQDASPSARRPGDGRRTFVRLLSPTEAAARLAADAPARR